MVAGQILWLIGASPAEAAALGRAVVEALRQEGRRAELITEADVADHLAAGLQDTPEDRETLQRRVGFLGHLLARNGVCALLADQPPPAPVWESLQECLGGLRAVVIGPDDAPAPAWIRIEADVPPADAAGRILSALADEEAAGQDRPA